MRDAGDAKKQVSALGQTRRKLAEAKFFFALVKRVEAAGPITEEQLDDEATYFLSALVGATYSVLQYLGKEGKRALRAPRDPKLALHGDSLEEQIAAINGRNGLLYDDPGPARGSRGRGLRHLYVHHKMVDAQHYEPTIGTLGSAPLGRLRFGAGEIVRSLYVTDPRTDSPVLIVPFMEHHLRELVQLVARWEHDIRSLSE